MRAPYWQGASGQIEDHIGAALQFGDAADDALTDLEGFRRNALNLAHEPWAFVERHDGDIVRNLRRTRMHDRQGVDFAAAARFDPFQVLSARPRLGHPRIEDIG